MTIDATGNVGISNSNPTWDLQVGDGAEPNKAVSIQSTNTSNSYLLLGDSDDDDVGLIQYNHASDFMALYTNASEAMRIDSTGNVGIGSTAGGASSKLTVADSNTSVGLEVIPDAANNRMTLLSYDRGASAYKTFNIHADDFTFKNDGVTESFRIDTTGNVGIGTTTPVDQLDVKASGDDERLVRISHPSTPTAAAGYFGFTDTGSGANTGVALGVQYAGDYFDAITIDRETQNVGIGSSNALYPLTVGDGTDAIETVNIVSTGSGQARLFFSDAVSQGQGRLTYDHSDDSLSVYTNDTERMRVDATGNVLVGGRTSWSAAVTDHGWQVSANGNVYQFSSVTGTSDAHRWYNGIGTLIANLQGNGNLVIQGTYSPSDERLKENIVDAPAGNLDDLRVRSYDWKADGSSVAHGFIAQELEVVAPYAVTKGETDEDMMAVDYSKLVPMLVKEIQDLKAEVEALKNA
jgi:hypothetical protein